MLQDIYPHQLKNNYTRCTPAAESLVFIYADGHFLLSPSKEPEANLPIYAELPDQLKAKTMQYGSVSRLWRRFSSSARTLS